MKKCIAILLLLTTIYIASAQNTSQPKEVINLTLRDGLQHNAISAMLLDSKGYLWIGTYDGLSIYNSHKISNIDFNDDIKSLLGRRVRSLAEDSDGNIWIGSDVGVAKFERDIHQITELPMPLTGIEGQKQFSVIKQFYIKKENHLYAIASDYGVLIYDMNGNLTQSIKAPNGVIISDAALLEDSTTILMTTNRGLYIYDKNSGIKRVESTPKSELRTLLVLDDNKVIVAPLFGLYEGAIEYNNGDYSYTKGSQLLYSDISYETIQADHSGALWLGCRLDGIQYIPNFANGERNKVTLRTNERISIFQPQDDNNMWVGTFDSGLFCYSKLTELFSDIASSIKDEVFRLPHVKSYDSTHLILHTLDKNVYIYNTTKGEISPLPSYIKGLNNSANTLYVKNSHGDDVLLTNNGYWLRVTKSGDVKRVETPELKSIASYIPLAAVADSNGGIWQGYKDNLYYARFSGTNIEMESLADHPLFKGREIPRIRTIYIDPLDEGIVWVGTTTHGLMRIKFNGKLANSKVDIWLHNSSDDNSLPSNFVSSILRDKDGILWIGTEYGGVCKMVDENNFIAITTQDGLSNNVVKSLAEDKNGDLWISTNFGLNRYVKSENQIFQYHTEDGLPFEQFIYDAGRLTSGELYFAGANGVLVFNPDNLSKSRKIPNLEFSNMTLLNRIITPNEIINGRVILDHALKDKSKIELKYDENMISFGVDVIHSVGVSNYQICYQLQPMSDEWMSVSANSGIITLHGLNAGNYTLNVYVTDDIGQKTEVKKLYINIAQHPLKSPLAFVIYAVIIITIVALILYNYIHNISLNYSLKLATIRSENIEKLNEEKQRYFLNIAHELKTPLALILAPANALAQRFKFDVDITTKVDVIRRQSNRMLQLIESTHKLNLDDMNILQPQMVEFDFDSFMNELLDDFKHLAGQENKELVINGSAVYAKGDKALLEMAICNILNNAFKYTKPDDKISVHYKVEDQSITLTVTDSGAGISEEDLPHIFERYYRGADAIKRRLGTGIGLSFTKRLIELHKGTIEVHSKLGVGASFSVKLPIITFPNNEIIVEKRSSSNNDSIILNNGCDVEPNINDDIRDSMVYVVEDNNEMRQMIVEALEPYFRVRAFESGESCMEQMASTWPHIVVSDVMMDGMSGYDLCRSIKGALATSHIPVILVTGLSSVDDKIKGLESGADSYIYKPFYINHLLTRIEHLLRGREELRRRFEAGIPIEFGESKEVSKLDNDFIDNLYKLFDANLDNEDVDMDYIASELCLSRAALYQKIKVVMGNTPYELLKNYRLTKAANLLQQGGVNINDICLMTGFKNRAHFSRIFKEKYGVSPSKYIKKSEC